MPLKTTLFDAADGIETAEDVAYFLEAAFEDFDAEYISHALGIVARSKGIGALAEKTGLSRDALQRALSVEGNPNLGTLISIIGALGLQLTVKEAA